MEGEGREVVWREARDMEREAGEGCIEALELRKEAEKGRWETFEV